MIFLATKSKMWTQHLEFLFLPSLFYYSLYRRPQVLASLFLFYDSCHRQINGHSSANPNPIKLLKYALKNMFNVSRWHEMQCHCKFFSLFLSLSFCFAASAVAAFSSEWLLRFWSLTFFTWASGPSRRSEKDQTACLLPLVQQQLRKQEETSRQGERERERERESNKQQATRAATTKTATQWVY